MEVYGTNEVKQFCKVYKLPKQNRYSTKFFTLLTYQELIILTPNFQDYVQNAVQEFILSSIGCFIVILSLAHFLMVLSANYAHIRGHDKFTELQDLHDLTSETLTLHDRGGIQNGTYPWQNK